VRDVLGLNRVRDVRALKFDKLVECIDLYRSTESASKADEYEE
jgi:hypothetical protein